MTAPDVTAPDTTSRDTAPSDMTAPAAPSASGTSAPEGRAADASARGPIVLFDGHCNMCSAWVQFVFAHEGRTAFRFASLQSATGARLLAAHRLPADLQTVVLIDDGGAYVRSTAVARMLRRLRAPWAVAGLLLSAIPRPLRDWLYAGVARRRYRWFGRRDECLMPTPAQRARFLG